MSSRAGIAAPPAFVSVDRRQTTQEILAAVVRAASIAMPVVFLAENYDELSGGVGLFTHNTESEILDFSLKVKGMDMVYTMRIC